MLSFIIILIVFTFFFATLSGTLYAGPAAVDWVKNQKIAREKRAKERAIEQEKMREAAVVSGAQNKEQLAAVQRTEQLIASQKEIKARNSVLNWDALDAWEDHFAHETKTEPIYSERPKNLVQELKETEGDDFRVVPTQDLRGIMTPTGFTPRYATYVEYHDKLIEEVKSGLLTTNEARKKLGKLPTNARLFVDSISQLDQLEQDKKTQSFVMRQEIMNILQRGDIGYVNGQVIRGDMAGTWTMKLPDGTFFYYGADTKKQQPPNFPRSFYERYPTHEMKS
jgi:hypothetical protein